MLHRVSRGWNRVGEVALDDADLVQALGMLRATASGLESGGVRTKLIIPEDQILYTRIPLAAQSDILRGAEVRTGLHGMTPYGVEDLVYDWVDEGDSAVVAVVARDTLDEAEDFASAHKFNPVSFVAIPRPDQFPREPWFGLTRAANGLLPPNDDLERDEAPITIVGRSPAAPPQAAPVAPPDPAPEPLAKPAAVSVTPPENPPELSFSSRRPHNDITAPAIAEASDPPRLTLSETVAPKTPTGPRELRDAGVTSPISPLDAEVPAPIRVATPPPPPPAVSEIAAMTATPDLAHGAVEEVQVAPPAAQSSTAPRRYLLAALLAIVVGAIALWAVLTSDRSPVVQGATPPAIPAVEQAEATPDTPSMPRDTETDVATLGPITAPVLPEPVGPTPDIAPDATTDVPLTDGLPPVIAAPARLTEEAAQTLYAATGIWPLAPSATGDVAMDDLENLYIASIDPAIISQDAVALPQAENDDLRPNTPTSPGAAGNVFDLDARGLVIPTPEGTLNPDGILVRTGRPPVVPPARTEPPEPDLTDLLAAADPSLAGLRPRPRPANLSELNERANLDGLSRAELAAIRPQARPASAQEEFTRQQATAPATALGSTVPLDEASSLALARSFKPVSRPKDFSKQVERALREARTAPAAPAVPATAAIAPRIPSSASVAKQATVQNAINLRKVNLIGVYGTKSDRRALVRLPSGRYLKVKVGDRIDGGQIAAISDSELRYIKKGRNIVLQMPRS